MKPIIYRSLIFFIMFFFSCTIFSQTVEEIIEKHITAHGGTEKWDKVDALKITGRFTAFSLENDYTCYKTSSGYYYADLYLGEVNVIEAFNGKTGWTIDPWQEIDYARKVNSAEENVFLQKAEFFTPFYNYKEKGHNVEYEGKENMDGIEVFVLKLTRTNGHVETWYLNAETYLEYLCKSDWVDFAYQAPSEVFFDDFRDVDGLILPFFTDRTFWQRSRILEITNVEINPEIDQEMFVMPRRVEMSKFEFLEGNWDVNVKAWTPRGTWYDLGNTTSVFEFVSPNMLQEKITYERIFLISRTTHFTWNDSGNNFRISVFNDLSTSLDFYEGAFNDTAFIFDDSNITFGDVAEEDNPINRYIIYNIEKEGFIMERKVSTDNGESWGPRDKFTYTRKEE